MHTLKHTHRSTSQQLRLPFDLPERPPPGLLTPDTIEVAPQQVWVTLPPALQTSFRRTLLRIVRGAAAPC